MSNSELNLLERLRTLDNPTPSETKLLKYFENTYPLIAFETIHTISEKCEVGTSTITRFVNRLGYESFSNFMELLKKEISLQLETPIQRFDHFNETDDLEGFGYMHLHTDFCMQNFRKTQSHMIPEHFNRAVEILSNTEGNLYITGSASSYGLAYYFYMLLTYIRPNVILLDPGPASLTHNLIDIDESDNLLAILHYRFSTQTVEVCKWFHARNAKTVLISDREHNPVSQIASVQLTASSKSSFMFNSRAATILILEALLASISSRRVENVHNRFETFEQLRNIFGTFTSSFLPDLEQSSSKNGKGPKE